MMPAIPIPKTKRPTRIAGSVVKKKPETPANVNMISDTARIGILPILSTAAPIKNPVQAIARAGNVIMKDIIASEASGKD